MKFIKNKAGWIQIVEAFVAVLLVAGFLLIILTKGYLPKADISDAVYETQISILREIQTNSTLRTKIAEIPEPLPIAWEDARFPPEIKDKITIRTPSSLDCVGRICRMNETCSLEESKGKDIYSQSAVISSTLQGESYRKLNLFCWAE